MASICTYRLSSNNNLVVAASSSVAGTLGHSDVHLVTYIYIAMTSLQVELMYVQLVCRHTSNIILLYTTISLLLVVIGIELIEGRRDSIAIGDEEMLATVVRQVHHHFTTVTEEEKGRRGGGKGGEAEEEVERGKKGEEEGEEEEKEEEEKEWERSRVGRRRDRFSARSKKRH